MLRIEKRVFCRKTRVGYFVNKMDNTMKTHSSYKMSDLYFQRLAFQRKSMEARPQARKGPKVQGPPLKAPSFKILICLGQPGLLDSPYASACKLKDIGKFLDDGVKSDKWSFIKLAVVH